MGVGGGLGALARYALSGLVLHHTASWRFPAATFVVNVMGCLLAGTLAGLVEKHDLFRPEMRLFLFTGLLGGFTTFSAFGLETVYLLRRGETWVALANVALSVLAGVAALALAMRAMPGR